ncbi:MAG TPA: hypothetical protein VEN81_12630, partial [Planctomycetota bacterium]|nr:hypothetical protein [Planctomycetota bacterium]
PSGLLLSLLGIFGGLYLVPQTTIFQARSPADRRGEYVAVQNFLNYAFMLAAAALFYILTKKLHLSPGSIFLTVGLGLAVLGVVQSALQPKLLLGPLVNLAGGGTGVEAPAAPEKAIAP